MATVKPILRRSKADKDGRCPIWLRISDRYGDQYVSLGRLTDVKKLLKVAPSYWNERQGRVRKGHPHSEQINELIVKHVARAEAEILQRAQEDEYATANQIKEALVPEERGNFLAFAEEHLKALETQDRIGRYRRLKATIGKLREFTKRPAPQPLHFDELTPKLIADFEAFYISQGNKQSTVATNLRDLKTLVNKAIRERKTDAGKNPFAHYRIKQGQAPERTKLSYAEILAIENLLLEPKSGIWHARNVFLFAFYCAGVRFSDVALMTQGRIIAGLDGEPDRLTYRMGKNGKVQSVKITPPARRILSTYLEGPRSEDSFVFPLLEGYDLSSATKLHNARASQNTLVNKNLKEIARLAGIEKPLSTHIARHSFADLARTRGWSIYDISKALQHSSIEMTERYLKAFDSEALDKGMISLFGAKK
jgi:integrase/recombinase XerD